MSRIIDASAAFAQYLETALWASTEISATDENCDTPLNKNFSVDDIDADTLAELKREFNEFLTRVYPILESIGDADYIDDEMLGHDFWLTRSNCGAGFWDGDWKSLGDALSDLASEYDTGITLYNGDDGKIYT